jgi:hypothetical protein
MSTEPVPQVPESLPDHLRAELDRVQFLALIVGAGALVVCIIGGFFSPAQFFRAYLAAYQWPLAVGLGSMVLLMLYHVTGGAWGFLIRRFLGAGMRTLPLLAILWIPIGMGVYYLYLWSRPEWVTHNHLQQMVIDRYLNPPFFWIRAAIYFVLWIGLAFFLSTWSRQQDQTGERQLPGKLQALSAPGFVIYGLSITFASVDWAMSLQPEFHSTMWGPLYATSQLLSAMAMACLMLGWLAGRPPLRQFISVEVLNDVGNLLLTFVIVWTYLCFFQFMLIWMANLPDEVCWYLPRSQGGWQWVAWALFIFQFAVPFFCLLMRGIKRNPVTLMWVARVASGKAGMVTK